MFEKCLAFFVSFSSRPVRCNWIHLATICTLQMAECVLLFCKHSHEHKRKKSVFKNSSKHFSRIMRFHYRHFQLHCARIIWYGSIVYIEYSAQFELVNSIRLHGTMFMVSFSRRSEKTVIITVNSTKITSEKKNRIMHTSAFCNCESLSRIGIAKATKYKKKHINIFSSAASMLLYFSFPFLTLAHSHFISTEHLLLLLLWLLWVRLHCISIFNALFRMAVCCRLHKCTWFYIVNPQCFASLRFKRYFISQLLHYFIFLFIHR